MSRVFLGLAGLTAAALLAAGCGGGGSKVSAAGSTPAAPAKATSASMRVVEVRNATLGSILEDAQGQTLYTYTGDVGGMIGCTGPCLTYWPPVLLPAGQKAPVAGPGVSGLGTTASPEGLQVTFRGQPLYTYVADTRPGETSGQNVVDSGGKWLVAALVAVPTPATTPPTAPPTTAAPTPPTTRAPATSPATSAPPPPVTSPPMTRAPAPTTPPTTSPAGGPSY
jgi:predicted lipoprotein with Yx(FWY)xxD motif